MTRKELINDILNEITYSNSLFTRVNDKELNRIIDIAINHFYTHTRYSKEEGHLKIDVGYFQTDEFKMTRKIILPDCIYSVDEVRNVDTPFSKTIATSGVSLSGILGAEMWYAPYMNDSMSYIASVKNYWDTASSLMLTHYSFEYNYTTRSLSFTGRVPNQDIYCHVYKVIPDYKLFTDPQFQRYVRAKANQRHCELLSVTGKLPLPGGMQNFIDYSTIIASAKEEMKEINEEMDQLNIPSFLVHNNGYK